MNLLHPKDAGLALQRKLRKRKPAAQASKPEKALQAQAEAYCAIKGLESFHMPEYVLKAAFGWNPHRHGSEFGAMRDAAAEVRGLPDLLIFDARRPGLVLAVELKTEIGKLSAAQRMWKLRLGTTVCRGFDEFRAAVDGWVK